MPPAPESTASQDEWADKFWFLHKCMRVWDYYETLIQNEWKRWIAVRVVSTLEHFVKYFRNNRDPRMTVALGHNCIATQNGLARQPLDPSLEDLLVEQTTAQLCESPPPENWDTNTDNAWYFLGADDDDIVVEELRPIVHATTMPTTSFVWEHTSEEPWTRHHKDDGPVIRCYQNYQKR